MPFHCLDCSSSQFFHIHRHNAIRDATIDLLNSVASSHTSIPSVFPKEPLVLPPTDDTSFPSLRDDAAAHNTSIIRTAPRQSAQDFRTSRAILDRLAPTAGSSPPPTGGTSTSPAAIPPPPPILCAASDRDPHGDPLSIPGLSRVLSLREADKRARYRPSLGDLVDQHLAIFLVEATERLSDPAMDLVKFVVKDSPSRSILNTFYSQIGGSIARYNAMAAHA
jgi:hypothetical protein